MELKYAEFLSICPLAKQDATSITEAILSQLEKWGLEIEYLRGQGYDGARTISGHVNGLLTMHPRALATGTIHKSLKPRSIPCGCPWMF